MTPACAATLPLLVNRSPGDLAAYAMAHEKTYRRIAAVAEVGDKLRMLDLTRAEVRAAVAAASHVNDLYAGALGSDYG